MQQNINFDYIKKKCVCCDEHKLKFISEELKIIQTSYTYVSTSIKYIIFSN